MTQILDGKALADKIRQEIRTEVDQMTASGKPAPHLIAILVGDVIASATYIRNKIKSCEEAGFKSTLLRLPAEISQEDLLNEIERINNDDSIDGLLVQLPLPKHIEESQVIEAISFSKDVDGFHPLNVGRMAKGLPAVLPATPYGILKILEEYNIETSGKHCVVIGRSNIVGSPISILMGRNAYPGNCTVTLCHSKTKDLASFTLQADIIIAAVGITHLLKADMVKAGAVIIDVGMNSVEDSTKKSGYRLTGDTDYEGLFGKVSAITPVPGGIGPMTIACLLLNTLEIAKRSHQ